MKKLFIILFFFSFSILATEKIKIKVKGMVCSFCTNGIESTFKKQKEVKSVNVNMKTKIVLIEFKKNKTLSEDKITKLITNSGFNVASIKKVK